MKIDSVSSENFSSIVLSESQRAELLISIRNEWYQSPPTLEFVNHVARIAKSFSTTADELSELIRREISSGCDLLLIHLINHPEISEESLLSIVDARMCIDELGHKSKSFQVLKRLAEDCNYPEAIQSVIHNHYATDDYSIDEFLEFVRKFIDQEWFREKILLYGLDLPEPWRSAAKTLVE